MIHKLTLRNFKGIESAELGLERLTVIVGPNASGKTSVLQALKLLLGLSNPYTRRTQLLSMHGGMAALQRRGGTQEPTLLQATGEWRSQPGTLQMRLMPAELPTIEGQERNDLDVRGTWGNSEFEIPEAPRSALRFLKTKRFDPSKLPLVIGDWEAHALLRLEARKLAEPSYTKAIEPKIDSDGSGLASVLAQMALNRPDDFHELLSALRSVIPQVVRVRLSLAEVKRQEDETLTINDEDVTRTVVRSYSGHRILFDLVGADGIPSQGASEGTLLVLGLLTVLFSTPKPKLVLLDDLDRGLHPKAQKDLVSQLRKLLERVPELQIIATSHSPYLVDHLDPKEVRLSTVLPDGTIRFAELTQHPDFERWKEVMRPGEFWSTVGESWVGSLKEKPRE
ncbi:MAG TPA: AAA family ATPase [Myxococcus sp.]|nr:AAA family ATPase [Myxococcus sp.]